MTSFGAVDGDLFIIINCGINALVVVLGYTAVKFVCIFLVTEI